MTRDPDRSGTLRTWWRTGRLQYLTLWALAVASVGLALADVTVLGFEPATLATLAAVFAASTASYERARGCRTTS
jgi:hypothetical protein